jgi:hypothetical protein
MKILLRVSIVFVGLVLALALIGLFLPGRYHVERSVVIAAKPEAVYPRIGDLKAWSQWGVWFKRDPAMQISYSQATSGVGAWSQWTSRTQGNGKMTISSEAPPEKFEYRMDFTDMSMVAHGAMLLAPVAGGTRVTMSMEGDLGHSPMNRWFGVLMGKMVGPDFDQGLANLKALSESAQAPRQ